MSHRHYETLGNGVERLTWGKAAERLDGFDFDFSRDIEWGAVHIDGERFSISVYRRGAEIVYCRACEHDPATYCLLSPDRTELMRMT